MREIDHHSNTRTIRRDQELRKNLSLVLFALLVALLVGCTMPESPLPAATATGGGSANGGVAAASSGSATSSGAANTAAGATAGTFKLTVPHLAPWVVKATAKASSSRAFVEADSGDFTIVDHNNDNATVGSGPLNGSTTVLAGTTAYTTSGVLPAGSYGVTVNIYNANDGEGAVVSGEADFTVIAGRTIPVTVTCFPVNSTTVEMPAQNTESVALSPGGYESWFWVPSGYATQTGFEVTASNYGESFGTVYYFVFYADGTYTGSFSTANPDNPSTFVDVNPSEGEA
ncbi:MAG TPA: hypothetical protein VFH83_14895, partial [Spirochaetia bacterium]|nr:hypothetical protein [Spirochaetia bacterium]